MAGKKRYYTLEEANAVLPKVKALVAKIREAEDARQEKQKAYSEIMLAIAQNGGDIPANYIEQLSKALDRGARLIQRLMENLQGKYQCEVKGLHPLLVDFYSLRDGREVYLCWKEDEENITHWHDLDAGFAGRQVL